MMRRNRKASLPVNSSVPPAVRRPRAASGRDSTVAYPASSSSSSSFCGSSSSDTRRRGDPLPLLLPERKAARWRDSPHLALNEPPPEPLAAAAQTAAPLPLPPPPPLLLHHPPPACAGGSRGARGWVGFQADIIMFNIFHSIPTQMDYKGQKLAEQIFQGIILFSAAVGFVYGFITEQFGWTVYIVMAGFALSCLLTLPPWPIYRRNPLKWLPAQESSTEDKKPTERKVKRHPKN